MAPLNLGAPETAPETTIHSLPRGTPGSASLDLACPVDVILSKWDDITVIPTGIKGTLPPGTVRLVIGRSSNINKHLEIVPGVVDSDTESDIKVMVKPLKETIQLHKGQRIAQLLLLPYIPLPTPVLTGKRGLGQFRSTDIAA
ncbi:deoxyuridine 5'-triphosphate nucleotidohydrolase-like [Sorex fumeus]|uniref:deoxyuridine 5'-triphosphate nucleotidohydrolase-like n=1 Tax=Sorex fumeus TaxID=62283 RepID=UPI0024ADD908|nr:deoxyuridine 5'-triphosphate nucleotidohydrolase-like [Sorex fumeus]